MAYLVAVTVVMWRIKPAAAEPVAAAGPGEPSP
jgi:hypothetical protein